jgi:cytochrome c oxidase cbb3-type subunit 2
MSSELAAAVAEALGAPQELVMRSAQARATAQGASVDDVLGAWAGGAPPPAAAPAPPASPAIEAKPTAEAESLPEITRAPEAAPAPEVTPAAAPAAKPEHEEESAFIPEDEPVAAPVGPEPAVTIVPGAAGRIGAVTLGAVALLVFAFVITVALPAADAVSAARAGIPGMTPQLSDAAREGRDVYVREGCAFCHTQQVRPIVTDADLGPATMPGTPAAGDVSTLGVQRVGPDLTHVGSREPTDTETWLLEYLRDPDGLRPGSPHPSYDYLTGRDIEGLAAFLVESK